MLLVFTLQSPRLLVLFVLMRIFIIIDTRLLAFHIILFALSIYSHKASVVVASAQSLREFPDSVTHALHLRTQVCNLVVESKVHEPVKVLVKFLAR